MPSFTPDQIAALVIATSFAAGLNVPATTGTLGVLSQAGLVTLPPPLQVLGSWWAIGASVALFVVELFADKIPVFDVLWNILQTFIRVPAGALLAYGATMDLSPGTQLLATILGALIAFAAHGGKTAVRAAVTPSPEPVSNIALSVGEDVAAIGITWLATRHPYWAAAIAITLVIVIIILARFVIAALQRMFGRSRGSGTGRRRTSAV